MSRWRWTLQQLGKKLWVKASLWALLAVFAALSAAVIDDYIPFDLPDSLTLSADAVESLLTIIASSMLAVTTFSLSTMIGAYGAATTNVTPRATTLLIEDQLSQRVLSTFIGSFLFSMVAIVALKTGFYGERGRAVLFAFTVLVIAFVVLMLLRWINHLTMLGRVGETITRVERATEAAINQRLANPFLGGKPGEGFPDAGAPSLLQVEAGKIGYLQHIDLTDLQEIAEEIDRPLHMIALPGNFVFADTAILELRRPEGLTPEDEAALIDKLRRAYSIGAGRDFDQDPRFGLMVMCEVGSRALSPATNDAGTAIDVIGRLTRLLWQWGKAKEEALSGPSQEPDFPSLYVEPLLEEDLFEDAFMLLARDGAGLIEVQLRLQKSLAALSRLGPPAFRAAAVEQARAALERARSAMTSDYDIRRLQKAAEWLDAA